MDMQARRTRKYHFNSSSLDVEVTSFKDMLQMIHRTYYVAMVKIDNNKNVYLADDKIGQIDFIPHDYKG